MGCNGIIAGTRDIENGMGGKTKKVVGMLLLTLMLGIHHFHCAGILRFRKLS